MLDADRLGQHHSDFRIASGDQMPTKLRLLLQVSGVLYGQTFAVVLLVLQGRSGGSEDVQ